MTTTATKSLALTLDAPVQITPMSMIQQALSQNASVEVLRDLFMLKKEVEADAARKAFFEAFNAFKTESVRIVKNIAISDGPLKGKRYADLFAVVDTVTPVLSKHGLSSSWKITKDEPAWIEVTCTIRHTMGHSELVSMGGPPDSGGAKNPIQARASSVSYLERYTFLAVTGMAAASTDTDGVAPSSLPQMPEPEYCEWMDAIQQAPNREALNDTWRKAMVSAEKWGDKSAKTQFIKAKDKAKEAL